MGRCRVPSSGVDQRPSNCSSYCKSCTYHGHRPTQSFREYMTRSDTASRGTSPNLSYPAPPLPPSLAPPLTPLPLRTALVVAIVSITRTGRKNPSSSRRHGQVGKPNVGRSGRCGISSLWMPVFKPGGVGEMTLVHSRDHTALLEAFVRRAESLAVTGRLGCR